MAAVVSSAMKRSVFKNRRGYRGRAAGFVAAVGVIEFVVLLPRANICQFRVGAHRAKDDDHVRPLVDSGAVLLKRQGGSRPPREIP